jgi:hypothetical protein
MVYLSAAIVNEKVLTGVRFYPASVELLFACTYEKSQGKTLEYLILCLHPNIWAQLDIRKLFVGLTRVRESVLMRVFPSDNLKLDRFLKYKHDKYTVLLNKAYDADGNFSEVLYRQANDDYEQQLLDDIQQYQQPSDAPRDSGGGRSNVTGRSRALAGRGPRGGGQQKGGRDGGRGGRGRQARGAVAGRGVGIESQQVDENIPAAVNTRLGRKSAINRSTTTSPRPT